MCTLNKKVLKNETKNETESINTEDLPNKFKLLWEWLHGNNF